MIDDKDREVRDEVDGAALGAPVKAVYAELIHYLYQTSHVALYTAVNASMCAGVFDRVSRMVRMSCENRGWSYE